jgi:hypothetical protein
MTWSLVVGAEGPVRAAQSAALEACGYDVIACPGPTIVDCPVVHGLGCQLVERAEVLLYDRSLAAVPADRSTLLDELRSLYADRPLILTELDGDASGGPRDHWVAEGVWRLIGRPDAGGVELLVEEALAERL